MLLFDMIADKLPQSIKDVVDSSFDRDEVQRCYEALGRAMDAVQPKSLMIAVWAALMLGCRFAQVAGLDDNAVFLVYARSWKLIEKAIPRRN